ncbi:ABC transporter ATP-binding protein [Allostella sp. ATCC 35155]|nr:ABC transporter ATP-binding protein [Stella sp. ATCC 35155]
MTALIEVAGLAKHFPLPRRGFGPRGAVRAVDGVSFRVAPGEVLGLVGESGSGKSTVGRLALRLLDPTAGRVRFDGQDITTASLRALRPLRRSMQMVFQDPYASLNPRRSVGEAIGEVLRLHGIGTRSERRDRAGALLAKVGLSAADLGRMPREFSGGQRQRIAIARALAVEPRFLVADEPVSALDVSVQAGILALLRGLQAELSLAMLFISHDLSVVEVMADRVMVLYLGRVMEVGPTRTMFTAPRHPYTAGLLAAAPRLDRGAAPAVVLRDEIPSPADPPSGCVFRTRCPFALADCAATVPEPRTVGPDHQMACIRDDVTF